VKLTDDLRPDALLFGEAPSRIVVSFAPDDVGKVRALAEQHGAPFTVLGSAGGRSLVVEGLLDVPVESLNTAHKQGFRKVVGG
jgi:phosphoribosylformylglycinamidine synthase subunit PurL